MVKKILMLSACLMLAACKPPGVTESFVKPAKPDYYKELPESFKLKHKVDVGEVSSYYSEDTSALLIDVDRVAPASYKGALTRMLREAKLLASGKPKYILTVQILDKQYPSAGLAHVTAGAAVSYRLTEVGSEREVYKKTLTSSYEQGFMFLLGDPNIARHQATGIAFGENAAQLVRELTDLEPMDSSVSSTIPLKRHKGAQK